MSVIGDYIETLEERIKRLEAAVFNSNKITEPKKEWYSLGEAAIYLNVSTATVRRLVTRKLLKRSGAIRHLKITRESLENYRKITTI